jgi:hypothetical protein
MRPEQPECQCLACAQLQHHQANDTLLLFAIGTVRYQHVMADRDAAIARELNRLIEGG